MLELALYDHPYTVVICSNCSVVIEGPYDETRQPAGLSTPVIEFSPVMIGSTIWINCSISNSFEPLLRVVFKEASGFNEIKLPTEATEEQSAFEYGASGYKTTSTGCGNINGDMNCYSFPIMIMSDSMDRAMVMCGAHKVSCSETFFATIGIIRIDNLATMTTSITDTPCLPSTGTSSMIDIKPTTPMSSTNVVNGFQGNKTTNSNFKCTDAFHAIIASSLFIVGLVFGFLLCLSIILIMRSRRNSENQCNEEPFNADLGRYPPPYNH